MPEVQDVSVHRLLRAAYRCLGRKYHSRELFFPEGVCVEIADDSDGHRTRKGYFRYRSAKMIKVGRKWWAIARGERCGHYPADPFDSDIAAVRLPCRLKVGTEAAAYVAEKLLRGEYFANSLVVGLADGRLLEIGGNIFSTAVSGILRDELPALISSPLRRDDRCLDLSTLAPVTVSTMRYHRRAIEVLTLAFEAVLGT